MLKIWKNWTSKFILQPVPQQAADLNVFLFSSKRFVLVKFNQDTIVQPIETEWFQFYTPYQDKVIQPLAENNAAVSIYFRNQM